MESDAFAFAESAIKRARQVGRGKAVSRWQEFAFFASACASGGAVGNCISLLGLWPIAHREQLPDPEQLHLSARLVERLLLGVGEERTPASRVRALLLMDAKEHDCTDLENIVRLAATQPVETILSHVRRKPHFWVNVIQPGFLARRLQEIKLKSWRLSGGKIAKWSGLTEGDPLPLFLLAPPDVPTAKQPKLEIRFETLPAELPKNSVEYRVSVRSGDDELAYREVTHQDKPYQTVRLTNEDFQDLPEDLQFEAQVRIDALVSMVVSRQYPKSF